jgi:hypothetical protein
MNIEARSLKEIQDDVRVARESKAKIDWSPQEIATDMLVVAQQLIIDIDKYLEKSMEAPSKRVRTGSKILETLGKAFRLQAVKNKK